MGAKNSRGRPAQHHAHFTREEQGHIDFLASKLAVGGKITQEAFDAHFDHWKPAPLAGRLFRAIASVMAEEGTPKIPAELTPVTFSRGLCLLLKAEPSASQWLYFFTMAHDDDSGAALLHSGHQITHFTLETFIRNSVHMSVAACSPNHQDPSTYTHPPTHVLHELLHSCRLELTTADEIAGVRHGVVTGKWQASDQEVMDLVQNMPESTMLARDIRAFVYKRVFGFADPASNPKEAHCLPSLLDRQLKPVRSSMLKDVHIWGLVKLILPTPTPTWHSLYSSDRDGIGKNRFLYHTLFYDGPSVLVVRDTTGHIFGAYAPEGWDPRKSQGGFYGKGAPALFSIAPHFHIYPGTGYNANNQYFHLKENTSVTNPDKKPEGLGLGGKIDYFGLWIDVDLSCGKSRGGCSSFRHSAPLSAQEDFQIESVELWGIAGDKVLHAQHTMRTRLEKQQLGNRAVNRAAAVGGALAATPDRWMLDLMGITGDSREYLGSEDASQQQQ